MDPKLNFVLFLAAVLAGEAAIGPYYKYSKDVKGWLKLHRMPVTWQEAYLRCRLEGALLASPINANVMSSMLELMKPVSTPLGVLTPPRAVFTGIHATFSSEDYFSIEGVPLAEVPARWAPGEPDNRGNTEHCVLLHQDGTLADVSCELPAPFVCYKKDKGDKSMITECGTYDGEYELDTRTDSCYKYHGLASTWSRAYMTCAAEGAHLAIIDSQLELNVLSELIDNNPNNTSTFKNKAHLGIRRALGDQWITVLGQNLEKSGYGKWMMHEPNNSTKDDFQGENCVSMFSASNVLHLDEYGVLNDIWCGHELAFICEMTPGYEESVTPDIDVELVRDFAKLPSPTHKQ